MVRLILISLLLITLAAGAYVLSRPGQPGHIQATIAAAEALRTDNTAGYARALEPRPFLFPADHGPHPEFRTEWWYYTGNLQSIDGRHFGFELTIFRISLAPAKAERQSDWATNQLYMAHLALTDVAGERFYAFERLSRDAQGLAGAQAQPFRVWVEDWVIEGQGLDAFPMRLQADAGEVAIDLTLESAKPPALQGDRGLSQKGEQPGNASYYYSLTRMPTSGSLRIGNEHYDVTGLSWMDREWSTSGLDEQQSGWDWFALQLEDGREVMYYRIRREDGSIDRHSSGTLIHRDGSTSPLDAGAVRLEVLDHWSSPRGGTYPSRWRITIPAQGLALEIEPYLADQELTVSTRYWEGAVRILDPDGRQLGSGYVELVGYADQLTPER